MGVAQVLDGDGEGRAFALKDVKFGAREAVVDIDKKANSDPRDFGPNLLLAVGLAGRGSADDHAVIGRVHCRGGPGREAAAGRTVKVGQRIGLKIDIGHADRRHLQAGRIVDNVVQVKCAGRAAIHAVGRADVGVVKGASIIVEAG